MFEHVIHVITDIYIHAGHVTSMSHTIMEGFAHINLKEG